MGINPTPTLGDRGVFRLEDGDKPHPYVGFRREDGDKPHPYIGGTLLVAKTEPDPNKPMEPHPYIGYHVVRQMINPWRMRIDPTPSIKRWLEIIFIH